MGKAGRINLAPTVHWYISELIKRGLSLPPKELMWRGGWSSGHLLCPIAHLDPSALEKWKRSEEEFSSLIGANSAFVRHFYTNWDRGNITYEMLREAWDRTKG